MAKVGKIVDLTHEPPPADAVLVKGEGDEEVKFGFGRFAVQARSRGPASSQRNSVTAKIGTAVEVLLYIAGAFVAAIGATEVAWRAGASPEATLGAAGGALLLVVVLVLVVTRGRREAGP
jgi:hypothetical protein